MRRQPHTLAFKHEGLDVSKDPMFIGDLASPEMNCVRYHNGLIMKDLGFGSFGGNLPLDSRIMFFDQYFKVAGTGYTLTATLDYLYKHNTSTGNWDKINSADAFTGDEDNQFSAAVMNDLYIITNGKDQVKKWDGTTWADLGDLTGKQARYVHPFYTHLLLGFTIETGTNCPHRVRWSDTGEPEDWSTGNASFFDLNDTSDWITGFAPMLGRMFVFKERSIWELYYVGQPRMFTYDLIIDGVGCAAPQGIISLGDEIIFFGNDNFYSFDGREIRPIGDKIHPLLYDTIEGIVNLDKVNRAPGVYVEELGEYWVAFPTIGEDPDTWFKIKMDGEMWTRRAKEATAFGYHSAAATVPWTDLSGNWTAQTWTWGEKQIRAGAPTTLIGDKSGYIYEDDRATKTSETFSYVTKPYRFAHAQRMISFNGEYKGGPVTISYSIDEGANWLKAKTFASQSSWSTFRYPINKKVQQITFKFESTAEDIDLKWIEPWRIPRRVSRDKVFPS